MPALFFQWLPPGSAGQKGTILTTQSVVWDLQHQLGAGSWELVRNAASETLPQIHGIRTGVLAGSPGELHSLQFEKP